MKFVPYTPAVELTNQFTMTYGPKGSGKSTFGLSMNEGMPILVLDLDRRSYSARETARREWGAKIVEIPGLEVEPDDKRTMDDILGKKQIKAVSSQGKKYSVWALDKAAAEDVKKKIVEGLAYAATCPLSEVSSIFIDDAKVLGRIWASCLSDDGRISSIPALAWGDIYSDLAKAIEPLTRTSGCTKDVILSHHLSEKYAPNPATGERERTGEWEPGWIDRLWKMADNVLEHYVNQETFQLGVRFPPAPYGKVPADNASYYGLAFEGLDNCRYDVIKGGLLRQLALTPVEREERG